MADLHRAEKKPDTADHAGKDSEPGNKLSVNDIDMKDFKAPERDKPGSMPVGFNHIETSTFDAIANKDGVVTKDALKRAANDPKLDDVQKDDVQHMLTNFSLLRNLVNDGGKGISREDIAKYNFPHEVNHIEDSTVAKLNKASDGTITKEAIADGLKRTDLSDVERDDMQYLQRQYANLKELSPSGTKPELGISIADIAASNARVGNYMAGVGRSTVTTSSGDFVLIDRYNTQRALDNLDKE